MWLGVKFIRKFEIDDPIETFSTQLVCGSWSIVSLGFFHKEKGLFYSGNPDLFKT
jgi:ammonia channel protein AmtB